MSDTLDLEIVNKFTGEVFTVTVNPYNMDSLVLALLQVQNQRKELDKLETDLKDIIEKDHLSTNDYRPVGSNVGYEARWYQSTRKIYDPTIVVNHLDIDMLLSKKVLTVANTHLEKLMAEMVRDKALPTTDSRAILDSIITKESKPYVKLEKIKK